MREEGNIRISVKVERLGKRKKKEEKQETTKKKINEKGQKRKEM